MQRSFAVRTELPSCFDSFREVQASQAVVVFLSCKLEADVQSFVLPTENVCLK